MLIIDCFTITFRAQKEISRMSNIKELVKQKTSKSQYGILLYARIRAILEKMILLRFSDVAYIKTSYKKRFGREIDFKRPKNLYRKVAVA